jgi:hypothetical protein
MAQPSWSSFRKVLASAASLAVTWIFVDLTLADRNTAAKDWIIVGPVIAIPTIAAGAIWLRRLSGQLLARGIWWSLLLFTTFLLATGPASGARRGGYLACFAATALLSAGREGLEGRSGRFQPVAFRGTLMLALVLAMADVVVFLSGGLGTLADGGTPTMLLFLVPMIASIVGLLRLATWGLIVSIATNLVVMLCLVTRLLDIPPELRALFVGTAGLQLIVPVPMLVTILRRRVPGPDRWQRAKRVATTAVIVAMLAFDVYAAFIRQPTFLRW